MVSDLQVSILSLLGPSLLDLFHLSPSLRIHGVPDTFQPRTSKKSISSFMSWILIGHPKTNHYCWKPPYILTKSKCSVCSSIFGIGEKIPHRRGEGRCPKSKMGHHGYIKDNLISPCFNNYICRNRKCACFYTENYFIAGKGTQRDFMLYLDDLDLVKFHHYLQM